MKNIDELINVKENLHTCVIVAHPDDETLWSGGTILMHPEWQCKVFTLCRASDPDRASKFYRVLTQLGGSGYMADFDDGPEQNSLSQHEIRHAILKYIKTKCYDLLVTHGPKGEYTRHKRHEEVSEAVLYLWYTGRIQAKALWLFAYTDGNKAFLPRPESSANCKIFLPLSIWKEKYRLITEVYGFSPDSWEAKTTPRIEAFWTFSSHKEIKKWLQRKDKS